MDDILREGHPALRTPAEPVKLPVSAADREVLLCMQQFLRNSQDPEMSARYKLRPGVGLSANQIGLNRRMFVMLVGDGQGNPVEYGLMNPKIVSHSVSMVYLPDGEGCLSVDRPVPGFVPRYETVKVKALDLNGKELQLRLKGYDAIVFQHELDHLNGVMFYDRINKENPYKLPQGVPIRNLYEERGE